MPPKKTTKGKASAPKKEESKASGEKRKRESTPNASDEQLKGLLSFLLHDASSKFGNGAGSDRPNLFDHMTYSASNTPFGNLVGAALMSKPISSRLQIRALITLFGGADGEGEYDLSTPAKIRDAGEDGRYAALSAAKTQHKDKTALQLGRLADKVIEEYAEDDTDTSLSKMREGLGGDGGKLEDIVKSFYMFGPTAADIFRRRMQADWSELYPFADERAMNAAAHLGLQHESAQALADQIKTVISAKNGEEERRNYSTIVDALVAVDLEHKYEDLADIMGSSSGGPHAKAAKQDDE